MSRSEEQILAEEIAALNTTSGRGRRVPRFAVRLMRTSVHETTVTVPRPFDAVVRHLAEELVHTGRVVDPEFPGPGRDQLTGRQAGRQTIRAVTGGGLFGMNPVVVTATVIRTDDAGSQVVLRAAAKEGLIPQRTSEKTVNRLAETLGPAQP